MERYQRPLDGARDDKKGLGLTWEKDREDFIWILFGGFRYYSYFCHRKMLDRLCTSFVFRRYKNLKPSNALIANMLCLCVRKRSFGWSSTMIWATICRLSARFMPIAEQMCNSIDGQERAEHFQRLLKEYNEWMQNQQRQQEAVQRVLREYYGFVPQRWPNDV